MWKSGTLRKVILPKHTPPPWRIWSGASLLAALLAGLLGFLSTSPALAGAAKLIALLFMIGFAVFLVIGRSSQKRAR